LRHRPRGVAEWNRGLALWAVALAGAGVDSVLEQRKARSQENACRRCRTACAVQVSGSPPRPAVRSVEHGENGAQAMLGIFYSRDFFRMQTIYR
jgi:hypothetical protein